MFAWLLELQGRDLGAHDSANPATEMHLDALETRIRLALPSGVSGLPQAWSACGCRCWCFRPSSRAYSSILPLLLPALSIAQHFELCPKAPRLVSEGWM